ncbi:MAG: NAD(P)-binding domain-containing protein, partial [Oscillospiraceae bacterium]|nr:NAD(P)-binding domain-containing protein [Oscillospiraceae bacterium]
MKLAGFVGTGKMGGALASAVIKKVGGENVLLADALPQKAEALSKECGCECATSNEVVANCKFAFLGVKPQVMNAVADSIETDISDKTILVSMAAGISISRIEDMFGKRPVIRIMPNTPASVGEGMILYTANELVKK